MASRPPVLGVVTRHSPPDDKGHSVSERSLPKHEVHGGRFAFKSQQSKYLRYLPADNQIKNQINLAMTGEDAKNPYTRFCLEPSRKHRDEGLVHIRCCYNNKYCVPNVVPQRGMDYSVIVCRADEPQDDESNAQCTLFRPVYHAGSTEKIISFYYKGMTGIVSVCFGNNDRDGYLYLVFDSVGLAQFTLIDLETHGLVLPEQVCFRGDNGMYLRQVDGKGLQFSANDIAHPRAQQTIVANEDGSFRIKNTYSDKFWRYDEPNGNEYGGVYPVADPRGEMQYDTIFHLVKLDNNAIALQVKCKNGKKVYCQRVYYDSDRRDLLRTATQFIVKEVKLEMHEAVLSRRIYNVEYHTLDARFYGKKTLTMTAAHAINRSKKENKVKLTLTFSSTKQATWESSVSAMAGVAVSMKVEVPEIVEALGVGLGFDIRTHFEVSSTYNWGETNIDTTQQSIEYEITVPSEKKVRLSLVATQGVCEIPFSYMREDILTSGGKVTSRLEDGLFRGVNSYNFQYEVKESPITDTDKDLKNNVNAKG